MNSIGPSSSLTKRSSPSLSFAAAEASASGIATVSESQTLSGLLRILRRRWKAVCFFTVIVFVLGTIGLFLITPQYASTSTIEVSRVDQEDTAIHETANTSIADELKTEIQTDITLLKSDVLALTVIRDLDLMSKRPFRSAAYEEEKGRPLDQAPRTREKALKLFQKNLKVESPPDTRLITVTFQNPDANLAAKVANSLCESFIANTMERRHSSIFQASRWLQKQLDALKKQVQESQQRLADYERETGLAGIQLSGSSMGDGTSTVSISPRNTITERLFSLNQELTAAEANRVSTEIIYNLLKSQDPEVVLGLGSMNISGPGGTGSAAFTADGGIQLLRALRSQETALSQDYAAYAVKYGENNPRLAQLRQQLETVRKEMKAELQRVSKRAENDYGYAAKNENAIREQFTKQESAANVLADKTVQLQVLAQEAYSNQALYNNLFSKLQTANLAAGVRATRIDVLDVARASGLPAFPPRDKVLAVLTLISVIFGISTGFLRESLDETVRTTHDLDQIADVPLLPYIPSLQAGRQRTSLRTNNSKLIEAPKSAVAEAFRALRTSITLEAATFSQKVFLVTSPSSGDGKTTVAYNLGVTFAHQGARVLLIDGDLRRPKLHVLFGCEVGPGLGDLKNSHSGAKIEGIVQHPGLPGLSLLPAGHMLEFPAEFLGSDVFASVLEACSRCYDYLFIDSPPLLSLTDASIIASRVTGIIAVLRSRSTTRPIFSSLINALRRTGTPTIGVLLNDVHKQNLDGFYEYSYEYSNASHTGDKSHADA